MKSAVFRPRRNLFSPLRSTMKQDRLNNCLLLHCHKLITDTLDTVKIAKKFACVNELRKRHFGKFEWGYALGLGYNESPPPPPFPHVSKRSAVSVIFHRRIPIAKHRYIGLIMPSFSAVKYFQTIFLPFRTGKRLIAPEKGRKKSKNLHICPRLL